MFNGESRKYCCVNGCQQTKEFNPDSSFFSLPTDVVRLNEWLKIIHRPDLMRQSSAKLKTYYVCSSHFEKHDTVQTGKTFLLPDAVPCRYLPETSFTESSQPQPFQPASSVIDWDDVILKASAPITSTPPENPLVIEETNAPPKVTLPAPKLLQDDLTRNMRKLLEDQIKVNKNKSSKNFLFYALNMYLLNPQAYRFVRAALKLPSENILKKINIKLFPKIDKRILDCLSAKLKSFPEKAKYCTVCVETIYLKSSLFYDILNDKLVGLQDIDGIKSEETAGLAYLVLLRSILVKWDQPVAYCFISSIKSISQIETWIDGIISNLFTIGFEVMALVSNQGSNFRKYVREIKGITPEQHYFMVDNKKVYYIYEVPQLLKCIRNNLGTKDAFYNEKRISWHFIELLCRLESRKKNKLIPKISNGHIVLATYMKQPSVRYAAEIFSNSVSRAMHSYIDMKKMPEDARETANFCDFMNNLFDVLNSSTYKNDNVYKSALGSNECQMELLREALTVFGGLEWRQNEQGKKKTQRTQTFRLLPSIQITLNSIMSISKDLAELGHTRILTDRLNLDPLESCVDIIRRMACTNYEPSNPTAKPRPVQLCRSFSKLFLKCIFAKSPLSDRPEGFQKYFEDASQLEINTINPIPSRSPIYLGGEIDYRIELPEEQQNAIIYVASFIFYKCHQAHSCHALNRYADGLPDLAKTKVYDNYNKKASFYGKLKLLHYPFIRYIEQLELAFVQNFKKGICSNPGTQLFSTLRDIPFSPPCKCFPKIYVVKLLIRLRMYTTIKAYNKQLRRKHISVSEFISELNKTFKTKESQ